MRISKIYIMGPSLLKCARQGDQTLILHQSSHCYNPCMLMGSKQVFQEALWKRVHQTVELAGPTKQGSGYCTPYVAEGGSLCITGPRSVPAEVVWV